MMGFERMRRLARGGDVEAAARLDKEKRRQNAISLVRIGVQYWGEPMRDRATPHGSSRGRRCFSQRAPRRSPLPPSVVATLCLEAGASSLRLRNPYWRRRVKRTAVVVRWREDELDRFRGVVGSEAVVFKTRRVWENHVAPEDPPPGEWGLAVQRAVGFMWSLVNANYSPSWYRHNKKWRRVKRPDRLVGDILWFDKFERLMKRYAEPPPVF